MVKPLHLAITHIRGLIFLTWNTGIILIVGCAGEFYHVALCHSWVALTAASRFQAAWMWRSMF